MSPNPRGLLKTCSGLLFALWEPYPATEGNHPLRSWAGQDCLQRHRLEINLLGFFVIDFDERGVIPTQESLDRLHSWLNSLGQDHNDLIEVHFGLTFDEEL